MSYQVIARKWRPQTFADLVGQSHVTETLANAIRNHRVAHAYIFSGARGVGKTTAARILAKALNCAKGPTAEPCGECASCLEIAAGTSLDVIEIDAASNRGIDQIRELREMVRYAPASSRGRVVILDEAHMLTDDASNALLKTLEEPPPGVIFVMATTAPEDLADTIRSRSQHFHFRALTFTEIAARIEHIAKQENLQLEPSAIAVIARMAEGSLRDALSLLEQARAYCGDNISGKDVRELLGVVPEDALEELVNAIAAGSAERALALVHSFQKEGRNLQHFCREAIRHMRNLLIARVCGADSDLIAATADQRPALERAAAQFSEEDLTRFFQILLQTAEDVRRKPDARVHLEMGLLRLINAARLAPLEELLADLGGGDPAPRSTAAGGSRASSAAPERIAPPRSPQPPFGEKSSSAPASLPAPVFGGGEKVFGGLASETPLAFAQPQSSASGGSAFPAAASRPPLYSPAPRATNFAPGAAAPEQLAPDAESEPEPAPVSGHEEHPALENVVPAREASSTNAANGHSGENLVAQSSAPAQASGLSPEQVAEIKSAIQSEKKFLGELVEHANRWELDGAELRLYFSPDKRAFAEMLESRDSLEKVRACSGKVLARPVRVCAKLETVAVAAASASPSGSAARELRERFERDPLVRSMLQRFGGKLGEVRLPK